MMRVLVACEFSGIIREAFRKLGHDAWSCDLLPTEIPGQHLQCDVREVLCEQWDLMIAHPPCTYLANSGNKHLYVNYHPENGRDEERWNQMREAVRFFRLFLNADIPHIAVENPIMNGQAKTLIGTEQTQVIQPWMFGHGETKATCLWLKNLPRLQATRYMQEKKARVHGEPPSPDRWKNRSRSYSGIAEAMAFQWGDLNYLPVQLSLFRVG